jgi:hypothetical protein
VFFFAKRSWNSGGAEKTGPIVLNLGLFTGGSLLSYATVGGTFNDVNPGGTWPDPTVGRIEVDTTAGNEIWTGLATPSVDGYAVMITVVNGNNYLQLDALNGASMANNQFEASGNLQISLGQRLILVYSIAISRGVNLWQVA